MACFWQAKNYHVLLWWKPGACLLKINGAQYFHSKYSKKLLALLTREKITSSLNVRSLNRGKLLATLLSSCRISWKIIVLLWIGRSRHVGFWPARKPIQRWHLDKESYGSWYATIVNIITLVHTIPLKHVPVHPTQYTWSPMTFW